jgi:hypothetical protein
MFRPLLPDYNLVKLPYKNKEKQEQIYFFLKKDIKKR